MTVTLLLSTIDFLCLGGHGHGCVIDPLFTEL